MLTVCVALPALAVKLTVGLIACGGTVIVVATIIICIYVACGTASPCCLGKLITVITATKYMQAQHQKSISSWLKHSSHTAQML